MNDADLTKAIFGPLFDTFGGTKLYKAVESYSRDYCIIAVPSIDLDIRPRGALDDYHNKFVTLTEAQTQRAYEILADYHSTDLELIAEKLVKGEIE